ncbi:MAG TPA: hypothetical protein VHG70_11540 [Nocardioidaceae bacterium]|nr:hypothetical protein [Nocardioidaceae bacterium]
MSETWDRVRRRYRLVEDVLGDVEREGIEALRAWEGALAAEYGAEDDDGLGGFLTDVQRRWQRAFDARLDAVLEDAGPDTAAAVAELWRQLAERFPATRLVLDAHHGHPALATAQARQRRMLKAATGVDLDDLRTDLFESQQTLGVDHGRKHCPYRGLLRLRPVCRRLHRGSVSAAGAPARVGTGA